MADRKPLICQWKVYLQMMQSQHRGLSQPGGDFAVDAKPQATLVGHSCCRWEIAKGVAGPA
jgi:hypothetical protein